MYSWAFSLHTLHGQLVFTTIFLETFFSHWKWENYFGSIREFLGCIYTVIQINEIHLKVQSQSSIMSFPIFGLFGLPKSTPASCKGQVANVLR